jgi:6-phosphogluconolactonase
MSAARRLFAGLPVLLLALGPVAACASDQFVFFGTHVSGPGKGFYLAHFDTDTGVLTTPRFDLEAKAPAYFVIDPDGRHLYTCNSGRPGGISAYGIEPHTGALTLINTKPAGGADTSYLSLDRSNRYAMVANYEGGNVAVFALAPDGGIGARTALVQHTGHGADPLRQKHAYAHSILTDPTNRFAVVCDLGLDRVFVYRFDAATGTLTPNDPAFVAVKPGSGPRHPVFHPSGRWVYVVTEMGSTVIAFHWDPLKGTLREFQTVSALPPAFKGTSVSAEIALHPNGRFLYASNRGDNSIASFAIDPATGRLTPLAHVSTLGRTPRNFAFDPTGKWIIVTNHDSGNAVVFSVNPATGALTAAGAPVPIPYPFCERFLAVAP